MFSIPDRTLVETLASELGFRLTDDELSLYLPKLVEHLDALDEFMQSRLEEYRPPLLHPARDPGFRPSEAQDPWNAWMWKCAIGGSDTGLLAGKTVSFKDHIPVAGIPMTYSAALHDGLIPDFDATVVTRSLAAGATVVGKNVMNGFSGGKGLGGTLGDYWTPLNPHDVSRLPGGSSSGSAVAVATGEVDISFGGDQGGSVRIPAAYCGVLGLKPSFGLVSHMGAVFGTDPLLDHIGPLARRVEDVALALQAVAGYDGLDVRQGRDVPDDIDVTSSLHEGVRGLTVGVLQEGFAGPVEESVRDGVLAAVKVLEQAGAKVVQVSVPEHATVNQAVGALGAEGAFALRQAGIFAGSAQQFFPRSVTVAVQRMWDHQSDHLFHRSRFHYLAAELSRRNFHGAVYAKAQNVRAGFIRAYDAALADVDVLVMPTCLTVAPKVPPARRPGERRTSGDRAHLGNQELHAQHPAVQLHGAPGARGSVRQGRRSAVQHADRRASTPGRDRPARGTGLRVRGRLGGARRSTGAGAERLAPGPPRVSAAGQDVPHVPEWGPLLITGAAGGIGRATVEAVLRRPSMSSRGTSTSPACTGCTPSAVPRGICGRPASTSPMPRSSTTRSPTRVSRARTHARSSAARVRRAQPGCPSPRVSSGSSRAPTSSSSGGSRTKGRRAAPWSP